MCKLTFPLIAMQVEYCVMFNRKHIINAWVSVENIFISNNTKASMCHICAFQGLWLQWKRAGVRIFFLPEKSKCYHFYHYILYSLCVDVIDVLKSLEKPAGKKKSLSSPQMV